LPRRTGLVLPKELHDLRDRGSIRRVRTLALFATLVLGACSSDPCVRDLDTQAVVIGIDGADWKVIDALAAAGGMPNLSRLRARGTSGPIETLHDISLSPVIWTSVATGKTADKHGIAWFMVDRADGKRVPVRSYNRKTKAIWNILAEHRRRPTVVGWWATYPAEDVGAGIVVSDGLGYHGFGSTARDGDDARKTHPASLFERVNALVPVEQQISAEFARRFIHLSPEEYREEMFDPGRRSPRNPENPIHLFQEYAITAQGYTAIAEDLLATEPYDLFMLYYEQVDSFSHLFMKYAPPKLDWVEQDAYDRYRDLVSEWYEYQDELLGRVLARIDLERTAVFVLSDHGFKSGERRIRSERTIDIRKAHLDHERDGIFIAAGPHIRRGAEVQDTSVLDITPTLLHYLGFAVARDMDGKVIEGIFEPEFRNENPIRYVTSYEAEDVERPAPTTEVADAPTDLELAEQMRRLQALGYVGGDTDSRDAEPAHIPPGEESSPEIHNNLGRVHLGRGELEAAQGEFEKALELDPNNASALLNMGAIRRVKGRVAEAEHFVKRALQVDPNSISALAQLAEIKRDQGDLDESIRLYREAMSIDDSQPFLFLGLGDSLQRAGRYEEAERAFTSVLELDPDSFEGHYDLAVTLMRRDRLDEAVEHFEKALELQHDHPVAAFALNNLGDIHLRRGETDRAIERFRRAVEVSPRHLESHYNLGTLYLAQGRIDEAIELLEQASRLQPDHELVNASLGMAYLQKGRNEDAYKSFLLVRRLYPRNWIAPFGLALLHAGSGRPQKARELLDESFRLGGEAARNEARNYPILRDLLGTE
jgi:tetratricopeptide (TPR) repeat protein